MESSFKNRPLEIKPPKNINLLGLDKNIAHLILGYLTNKDLVKVCCVSKNLHSLFYPSLEKRLMPLFLKYVVEGRLDKAKEILNKNQKLVFLSGDITDLSGRVFPRITAFQYATWLLDKEMWELILKYLPETDAYEQLRAFEHERLDITHIHGKWLNFEPLLAAYQKYIDNFDKWNGEQHKACWCKEVGSAQRQMPAWFVYVFCEEREDKVWSKGDFERNFMRDPKHLSLWFHGEENGGKLGVRFGVVRGAQRHVAQRVVRVVAFWEGLGAPIDRQRLNSSQAERTSCRDLLSDYLKRAVETKNLPATFNNSRK